MVSAGISGFHHRGRGIPGPPTQRVIDHAHHFAPGWLRCSDCISASRRPRCSEWRPQRPPLCIQPSGGRASVARARTEFIVFVTVRSRIVPGSGITPAANSIAAVSSVSNNSAVNGQSASSAVSARRRLSAVPSPSRIPHSAAWRRW